ncbi:glycosyltransferase family 39 protein [Patescibacteria group bacterium]|nr:glycosyltransferase family 39 protein [Patescibacteria group bacterium]
MKKVKINTIGAIVVLALILRLIAINQSLWLDEAINLIAARDLSLTGLLFTYMIGDFHPPLFHTMLWGWFKIFPAGEVSARIPSVIFGAATVVVTYNIAKLVTKGEKYQSHISRLSAFLLATSGLHIYYSQEARMYALAAFFTTLTFFALLQLKEEPSPQNKALFTGSLVLMLLSDYQPWLLLPLFFVLRPGLTAFATLMTLPWWPMLSRQIERGLETTQAFPAWETVVGTLSIKSALLVPVKFMVGRTSIDNNLIFALALLIPVSVVLISIFKAFQKRKWYRRVLQGWLAVPFVVAAIVSLKIPVFSYFRFLFVLPVFYLLIALGVTRLSVRYQKLAVAVLLVTNIISAGAYLFLPRFHREDWRGMVNYVQQLDPAGTLVVFPSLAQSAAFDYYNTNQLRTQDKKTLDLHENAGTVFLVRYVSEIFDPENQLVEALQRNGFEKVSEVAFRGILIWQYKRVDL